jgi:menaquinone-specific isochorismate synthase
MILLDDIKRLIILDLKEKLDKGEDSSGLKCHCISLPRMELWHLVPLTGDYAVTYFRDRQGEHEILGLGALEQVSRIADLNLIKKWQEECPEMTILGGRRFDLDKPISEEWENFEQCCFILPVIKLERRGGKTTLSVYYNNRLPLERVMFEVTRLLDLPSSLDTSSDINSSLYGQIPNKDIWEDKINLCLQSFERQELDKVVMARKRIITTSPHLEANELFWCCPPHDDSFTFFIKLSDQEAFLSLTPERLFKTEGRTLFTEAVAGTRPRGRDEEEDIELGEQLLSSVKEMHEHRVVADDILSKTSLLCHCTDRQQKHSVLKLKHVQHIHTRFKGKLYDGVSIEELIDKFHPTPAVGGRPWSMAREFIRKHESFDRGLYAAPIGHIGQHETEFAVGIRSILLKQGMLHVFGGAGIVEGSKGSEEWMETREKMKNFSHLM